MALKCSPEKCDFRYAAIFCLNEFFCEMADKNFFISLAVICLVETFWFLVAKNEIRLR